MAKQGLASMGREKLSSVITSDVGEIHEGAIKKGPSQRSIGRTPYCVLGLPQL